MRRVPRHRDERGAAAIEFLLVVGMLLLVFLVMLQYAVQAHAKRVATAAAEEALVAAAAYDGTAADGLATGTDYLDDLGAALSNATVEVTRTATTATVTITGEADQLSPVSVHVRVHLEAPVERFVGEP